MIVWLACPKSAICAYYEKNRPTAVADYFCIADLRVF
jgi:hypothetical protein